MDILAHAVYGATVFSQKGLAGGKRSQVGIRWFSDGTVWAAALFGIVPDVISMWPALAIYIWDGMPGNYFAGVGGTTLILYHYMHSLVIALPVCALMYWWKKPYFVSSLAWPLHVMMDAATHGTGKFQTQPLYPLLDWKIPGINWWEVPAVFIGYWTVLPVIWVGLWAWRRR